ncbi:DCP1-domain-containing protein [Basidiobolus meristosporus CBS 931.73]|uniref:DCP1-domain-containing protein n=1 Tax=Basidiobolus meristosporus CBS 931.73 TaxID=1314790 RepID=A0A1Y1XX41_9FUNG|nr:DCP1-domain-containing protein [Basidiobolus meristosporus CBS 931.73]|eukprot:ORX90235.1 DCP1-domain-containing protein [Basidiobolus meristosporus CBS 931.73]
MDPEARRAANLNVLQRLDRRISEILDSSSHVVVYKFDNDTQSWTKKNVEGTMFLFKREVSPKYGFFVMNRLSIDNFIVYLNGNMDLQITTDFIIYRTGEEDIHGIWMYETADRERVGRELVEYVPRWSLFLVPNSGFSLHTLTSFVRVAIARRLNTKT